ncbi:MAG: di-heme enzyme [Novosphingobium sp.]|nr:di-heme enzyme [Novosphingobium sp.]
MLTFLITSAQQFLSGAPRRISRLGWLGTVLVVALAGGAVVRAAAPSSVFRWDIPAWLPPPPVPADNPMSDAKVLLGRHLFYDARLSRDGTLACVSCHLPSHGFADRRPLAVGIDGQRASRNAMGLANVGYLPVLTWSNPNLTSLEFQSLIPIFGTHPEEMGMAGREEALFATLSADPTYRRLFGEAFPERGGEINLFTLTRALGAFQRTLVSASSPYDRYKYGGDDSAISDAAKRGENLFFDHRLECYHCHSGFNFTNTWQSSRMPFPEIGFHNNGLYNIDGNGAYPKSAPGLIEHTGKAEDMGRFRTPSLRNVELTAPYMHDGSIATLEEVIRHYEAGGRRIHAGPRAGIGFDNPFKDFLIQGFRLSDEERADLIAFLKSLTDRRFVENPAFADPWPAGHDATRQRRMSPE